MIIRRGTRATKRNLFEAAAVAQTLEESRASSAEEKKDDSASSLSFEHNTTLQWPSSSSSPPLDDGGKCKGHFRHNNNISRWLWSLSTTIRRLSARAASAQRESMKNKGFLLASLLPLLAFGVLLTGVTSFLLQSSSRQFQVNTNLRVRSPYVGSQTVILPGHFISSKEDFVKPSYGHLHFDFLSSSQPGQQPQQQRQPHRKIVYSRDDEIFRTFEPEDEHVPSYHAYDDDVKRVPQLTAKHRQPGRHCRQTAMHRDFYPTCNNVHAVDFASLALENRGKYLGGGSFRNVFLLKGDHNHPSMVLKTVASDASYKMKSWEYYRVDAAVTAAVSPHPLFVDVYGACGMAMLSEAMSRGDLFHTAVPKYDRHQCDRYNIENRTHLKHMNDLSPTTKLEWALQMAESIAILHNHHRGVIVHDDIRLYQWLISDDGKYVKLNDFNRAEMMLYDEDKREYCRYQNGVGPGSNRSPEEYFNDPLNEKIDIFSLGNSFYSLITGVQPIYKECSTGRVGKHIRQGEKPYFDPRWKENSFAEGELVKIIYKCWERKPDQRLSATELVLLLRQAVEENRKRLEEEGE